MPLKDISLLRVLLVDDFEIIRTNIREALARIEVKSVLEAKDGVEALELLRKEYSEGRQVDLIFCDWNMPNMTGIDLLRTCKQDDKIKQIPFIMVTSESEKGAVLEALKLGAMDYVVKPFSMNTIEKKIQKLMEKKS